MKLAFKIAVPIFSLALLSGYIYTRIQVSAQADELLSYVDADLESPDESENATPEPKLKLMPGSKSGAVFEPAPSVEYQGNSIRKRAGYPPTETLQGHQVLSSSKSLTGVISADMVPSKWRTKPNQAAQPNMQICYARKTILKGQTIQADDFDSFVQSGWNLKFLEHLPVEPKELVGRNAKVKIEKGTMIHANLLESISK